MKKSGPCRDQTNSRGLVDDVHQPLDVISRETSTKVARGRRVRNRSGAERIEEWLVVAPQFDVVERPPTAHGVVGDVQDVVRLVIGLVYLEKLDCVIDALDKPRLHCDLVGCTNPTVSHRLHAAGDLVGHPAGAHDRLAGVLPLARSCQPPLDSALARTDSRAYSFIHLKSLLVYPGSTLISQVYRAFQASSALNCA